MTLTTLKKLWNDECGAIVTAELILVGSLLIMGIVAGLSAVRVAVVTELADVGQAVATVNQSYSLSGTVGCHSATGGSAFRDLRDTCDNETREGVSSRGLRMTDAAQSEGQRVLSRQVIDIRTNQVVNVDDRYLHSNHDTATILRGESDQTRSWTSNWDIVSTK